MTDPAIAGSNRFGPSGVGGFHQVVLASFDMTIGFGGFDVQPNGGAPVPIAWAGHAGSGIPAVLQDTDGYSGAPGDWQFVGPLFSVKIPAGLGGTYEAGFEKRQVGTAWWGGSEGHPPAPRPVPYVPGHVWVSPKDGLIGAGVHWSVTYDLRANGAIVATYLSTGTGGYTQTVDGNIDASGLAFADGDVISLTTTWHDVWLVANFSNSLMNGTMEAVLFLTRTGGPGGKPFLRGHVAL